MRKKFSFIVLFLIPVVLFSCRREDLSINQVVFQPYVSKDSSMGMSVYVYANIPDIDRTEMQITSPDGTLKWNITPEKVSYGDLTYTGTSSLAMPKGCDLPRGEWKLLLMYKDGRSVEQLFKVDYRNKEGLVEASSQTDEVFFSSSSNLTYLP